MNAARKRVASLLSHLAKWIENSQLQAVGRSRPGIVSSSAPETQELMTPEPARGCVRERCCAEFTLNDQDWSW